MNVLDETKKTSVNPPMTWKCHLLSLHINFFIYAVVTLKTIVELCED